jgi:hypothetical protein
MTTKLSKRWSFALVVSIIVLLTGLLGLGVRTFASALIFDSIFLAAFGLVLVTLPIYFALRRRPKHGAINRKVLWPPRHISAWRTDRRRPAVRGQQRGAVANERRSRQLGGFKTVSVMPRD